MKEKSQSLAPQQRTLNVRLVLLCLSIYYVQTAAVIKKEKKKYKHLNHVYTAEAKQQDTYALAILWRVGKKWVVPLY